MVCLASGCVRTVAFDDTDTSWHYNLGASKYDAGLVAVIDTETLGKTYEIRSFMAGAVNTWEARVGEMLTQVATVEFPQMFEYFDIARAYAEPDDGARRMTVVLTVPEYSFADFHATIGVRARAYGPGHVLIFEKRYTAEGETQGAKMYWAGAFGMKSAVRQSSLDAYKQIFAQLRSDLKDGLSNPFTMA